MKASILLIVIVLFTGCSTSRLETPIERLDPLVLYPDASVYKLLAAPGDLEGKRIRTNGVARFFFDGSGAYLYASRQDAREERPLNRIELYFSAALAAKPWFKRFARQKVMFSGWMVGVVKTVGGPEPHTILDDVTEFDVRSTE